MNICYGKKYKNSSKCLKKKHAELRTLDLILYHIKQCNDFQELNSNTISNMYGFEALKHELNGYYSFNLEKNSGTTRLILSVKDDYTVILEFVSNDHYRDFKNKL